MWNLISGAGKFSKYGHGYDYGCAYSQWGGFLFYKVIFVLLFIAAIILFVYLLFRIFGKGKAPPPSSEKPLEVLKERYAKGEIDKKEFDQIKKDLSS